MKGSCIIYVISIVTLLSCESGVEFENIPTKNLLSVSSFISPQDTVFTAYLYSARELGSISNRDSSVVKDAIVIISDEITSDTLVYQSKTKRYEIKRKNLTILPLHTYFLTVLTSAGEVLNASCIIPPTPLIPIIEGEKKDNDFLFSVKWNNPFDYKYFTLIASAEGTYEFTYPWGTQTEQLSANFIDDLIFPSDGQSMTNIYVGIVPFAYTADSPKLKITLRNVENNIFKYLESYRKYQNWDANNSGNLFPNFQEPKPIFTNITAGVGIFAGYNQSFVEVDI